MAITKMTFLVQDIFRATQSFRRLCPNGLRLLVTFATQSAEIVRRDFSPIGHCFQECFRDSRGTFSDMRPLEEYFRKYSSWEAAKAT